MAEPEVEEAEAESLSFSDPDQPIHASTAHGSPPRIEIRNDVARSRIGEETEGVEDEDDEDEDEDECKKEDKEEKYALIPLSPFPFSFSSSHSFASVLSCSKTKWAIDASPCKAEAFLLPLFDPACSWRLDAIAGERSISASESS